MNVQANQYYYFMHYFVRCTDLNKSCFNYHEYRVKRVNCYPLNSLQINEMRLYVCLITQHKENLWLTTEC